MYCFLCWITSDQLEIQDNHKGDYGTALRQRRVREPIIRERRAYSIE